MDPRERASRAMAFFREGCNCCQSVALAFSDVVKEKTGLDEGQIRALTSGFGGGFGRMREVCGCVSGLTFLAGAVSPADPSDRESRRRNYALVQELASRFRDENGSIVCRELLELRSAGPDAPQPSERNAHYYASRPCERLVGCAAFIFAEKLNY